MGRERKTTLLARLGRIALTLGVTLGIAVAAIGVGVAAHGVLSSRAVAEIGPDPAPLSTVSPIAITMQDILVVERRFTGQFEAPQDSVLSFEEGGTIHTILVEEGDRVAAGDLLARLDTRVLRAERARLSASRDSIAAEVELARRTDARQQALLADGHVTAQRVDETSLQLTRLTAALAETEAALGLVDVRLDKAVLRAPFAGVIGDRALDLGAVAGPGAPVVTVQETGRGRFRVGLDPSLAAGLSHDDTVTIQAQGRTYQARLVDLLPALDAATRSRIAVFEVIGDAEAPTAGTAGEVMIADTRAEAGAWVPLSALRQGPRGSWLLLTVIGGDAPEIAVEAAEILHLDAGRAYVRGTFGADALILPDGTHRVVPGEPVRVSDGEAS